jgi:hypothetical protein
MPIVVLDELIDLALPQAERGDCIAGHMNGSTLLDQRRDEPLGVINLIRTDLRRHSWAEYACAVGA